MQTVQKSNPTENYPLPPRTTGFPLLGSLPEIFQKQTDYFFEAWRQCGDIYTLNMGTFEFIVLNHPDYAQQVLRDNARNYSKGGVMWDAVRTMLGNGLATSEGDYWRRQRRMMQPQFHRQYLAGLTDLMVEAIAEATSDWNKLVASGEAVDAGQVFAKITMNVIMKTMFGRSIDPQELRIMEEAFSFGIRYLPQEMVTGRLPDWMPVPKRKQYQATLAKIDEFVYRVISEHRRNPTDSLNLVSMMINMIDDESNEPMTDKEIRDEVATIFAAGFETTSLAMAWGAYVLSQESAIQERLIAHVDEVLEGRVTRFEDLSKLDYLRMFISETMRLYPPAFWFSRTALADDVIGSYRIKAGQLVAVVPLTIHRHPDFWPNPELFEPQRFNPEAEKGRHPLAWMPFGAGQRQCIGKDFAMMESTLILADLMQRYRIVPANKPTPQFAFSGSLGSRNGIWIRLEKR